jgi:hypothetical protein
MNKKEFKELLDYLFGEIHGIDTYKICFDDYNYEDNMTLIVNYLRIEEFELRKIFSDYDIQILETNQLDNMLSKLSSASLIYKELDEKYFFHEMLLNKEVIGKIIYHKILKSSRIYKIHGLLE